jgi:hypothetical protein
MAQQYRLHTALSYLFVQYQRRIIPTVNAPSVRATVETDLQELVKRLASIIVLGMYLTGLVCQDIVIQTKDHLV